MASLILILVIFSSLVFSGSCGTSFSNQQEVKTIKTKYGVYDCVDFYKQPTFNHPLLKDRTSKVIPNLAELQGQRINGFGLQDGGCPIGTVPILRTNLNSSSVDNLQPSPQHCVAIVHTNKLDRKFFGVSGAFTVYKSVVYNHNQSSFARIKLSNVNDSIEVGWMVNPEVFNDYEAHLYASFAVGALGGKGCINLQCPGFVQVATDTPLGLTSPKYSVIGGIQVAWYLSIDRHQDDGNWWLSVTRYKKPIGYWPSELFFTLAGFANKVEWGGEIINVEVVPSVPPPQMGNGLKASNDILRSATVFNASYIDEHFTNVTNPEDTHTVMDCEELYTVLDGGYISEQFGRKIYFGGSG